MFELKIENEKKQILTLSQNESNYQIISITGLNPPKATINTIKSANKDGSSFNSSFLEERNIVLTVGIVGDVAKNRLKLYEFLGSGSYCKIYYNNGLRDVYCEGHIEQIETDLFAMLQQVQISILCEDPFLYALNQIYVDISKLFRNFEFPFSIGSEGKEISIININRRTEILNLGEPTGIEIKLFINNDVTVSNPVIYNANSGEFFKLKTELNKGDVILINTNKGKKSIKKIVDGIEQNIINSLESGSTWFLLNTGLNVFTYSADTNQSLLFVEFNYNVVYKGV
jgi:hypothetical protein